MCCPRGSNPLDTYLSQVGARQLPDRRSRALQRHGERQAPGGQERPRPHRGLPPRFSLRPPSPCACCTRDRLTCGPCTPQPEPLDSNLFPHTLHPETSNPQTEIRNPKPNPQNPKLETRNPKHETRNPKHEFRNPPPHPKTPKPKPNLKPPSVICRFPKP